MKSVVDDLRCVGDRRGEEQPTASLDGTRKNWTDRFTRDVIKKVRTGGKLPGRPSLSYARPPMTYADVTVGRAGNGELREARMFAGFDEG